MKQRGLIFFFLIIIYLFIYFWLLWVFIALGGLSLVVVSRGLLLVTMHRLLIAEASLVPEHRLQARAFSSPNTQAQLVVLT